MRPELFIATHCTIGEGPVWDERTGELYFIDILERRMYRSKGAQITGTLEFPESTGFAVLREGGGVAAGLQKGLYLADFEGSQPVLVADPEPGRDEGRFNDGKVDPLGRIWGGTMPTSLDTGYGEAGPDSGLYCIDEGFNVKTLLTGVIQGNGLAWSPDGSRFYYVDTQRFQVSAYDCDLEKCELSGGRVLFKVPAEMGIPDGMTIDDDGFLWLALWGGHCLSRWNAQTGRLEEKIEVPALNVTSCCFGGPAMDELYITTGALGTDREKYPLAGGVFALKTGVRGALSYRYKG